MDAVSALRYEFPALGLTLGFAPARERGLLADILLFWLEMNRARAASESLIAAARITWWKDAFASGTTGNVPLAERLLEQARIAPQVLAELAGDMAGLTLDGAPDGVVMHRFAPVITGVFGGDADDLAHILLAFKAAMAGQATDLPPQSSPQSSSLPMPFRMMGWMAKDPHWLNYPDEQPMLALAMIWAKLRGQV
ncbi:MAG: hypothetical protein J4F41_05850 [Alphaproteobacteria bacterium]|nr:hypothetical protein [Alphaproteobacteria bacterium]